MLAVLTLLASPPAIAATPNAAPTTDFIRSIGVNQHLGYPGTVYANASLELTELQYLGISLVRDQAPSKSSLNQYRLLANAGVKFNLITSPAGQDVENTLPDDLDWISALATSVRDSVRFVEGPNELNGDQIVYWHGASSKNPETGVNIVRAVSKAVRAHPALKGVSVVNISINNGGHGWQAYVAGLGDLSAYVDFANWHVYFNRGDQPLSHVISMSKDALRSAPGRPVVFTEAGYTTAYQSDIGVDETTQASHTLHLLADAFSAGVKYCYLYELMDGADSPAATDIENQFGLFRANGAPKPAATAIHNLVAVLAKQPPVSEAAGAEAPRYTFLNLPNTARSLLLRKSDAVFDLIVWNEPRDWDLYTHARIPAHADEVVVKFDRPSALKVFNPLHGTDAVKSVIDSTSVALQLADQMFIVEIVVPG